MQKYVHIIYMLRLFSFQAKCCLFVYVRKFDYASLCPLSLNEFVLHLFDCMKKVSVRLLLNTTVW